MSDHRIEYSSILATEYSGIIFHRQLHIPSLEVNLLSIDGAYCVHARVEFHHPRLSLLLIVDFSTLSDKAEVKRVDIDFNTVLCIRKVQPVRVQINVEIGLRKPVEVQLRHPYASLSLSSKHAGSIEPEAVREHGGDVVKL